MYILVDPKIFSAAFANDAYAKTLASLEQDKADFCFVVTRVLAERYWESIASHGRRGWYWSAIGEFRGQAYDGRHCLQTHHA